MLARFSKTFDTLPANAWNLLALYATAAFLYTAYLLLFQLGSGSLAERLACVTLSVASLALIKRSPIAIALGSTLRRHSGRVFRITLFSFSLLLIASGLTMVFTGVRRRADRDIDMVRLIELGSALQRYQRTHATLPQGSQLQVMQSLDGYISMSEDNPWRDKLDKGFQFNRAVLGKPESAFLKHEGETVVAYTEEPIATPSPYRLVLFMDGNVDCVKEEPFLRLQEETTKRALAARTMPKQVLISTLARRH